LSDITTVVRSIWPANGIQKSRDKFALRVVLTESGCLRARPNVSRRRSGVRV